MDNGGKKSSSIKRRAREIAELVRSAGPSRSPPAKRTRAEIRASAATERQRDTTASVVSTMPPARRASTGAIGWTRAGRTARKLSHGIHQSLYQTATLADTTPTSFKKRLPMGIMPSAQMLHSRSPPTEPAVSPSSASTSASAMSSATSSSVSRVGAAAAAVAPEGAGVQRLRALDTRVLRRMAKMMSVQQWRLHSRAPTKTDIYYDSARTCNCGAVRSPTHWSRLVPRQALENRLAGTKIAQLDAVSRAQLLAELLRRKGQTRTAA